MFSGEVYPGALSSYEVNYICGRIYQPEVIHYLVSWKPRTRIGSTITILYVVTDIT